MRTFAEDFAPLRAALRTGMAKKVAVLTPEQMVVELRLTPAKILYLKKTGVPADLVATLHAVYWTMRRHRLLPDRKKNLPANDRWPAWLKIYRARTTKTH